MSIKDAKINEKKMGFLPIFYAHPYPIILLFSLAKPPYINSPSPLSIIEFLFRPICFRNYYF